MRRLIAGASALTLALAFSGPAALADEAGLAAWRLFVADHTAPTVRVIDALDGDLLDSFTLAGPARLHRTSSGETVFAVQGAAGRVDAIATGIAFHEHGDHADIDVDDAGLLHLHIEGARPAHLAERQGIVAQWFDGEDAVRIFSEKAALAEKPEARTVGIGTAHHGVAVPYQNHVVASIADPDDASRLPVGARILDLDGGTVGEDAACPGLHGSAGSGSLHALACDTGLLLIRQEGDAPAISHLPWPASLPEGSSSTLIGGVGLQYFIGDYGPDRVVVIDPSEGENGFRQVELPARRVDFAVDPIRPRFAYVATADGRLHKIDVLDGAIVGSLALTGPYSLEGDRNAARPRIAVAGDNVVVSDPLAGKLHLVDAASFAKASEIAVEGTPSAIVAVGGAGAVHAHEGEGHSHDHD